MTGYLKSETAARELHGKIGDGKVVIAEINGKRHLVDISKWDGVTSDDSPQNAVHAELLTPGDLRGDGVRDATPNEQQLIDSVAWK